MKESEVQEQFAKAIMHIGRKEYEPALRILDLVLLENSNFVPGWNERAALLAQLNAQFDAVVNYTMALNLNDKEGGIYVNRGVSLMALNQMDKAIGDFQKGLELNPAMPEAYNNTGIALRRMGLTEPAIKQFRKAIDYRHDYADAHLGLGMCLLELQQWDEGWKEFEWRWKCGQMVQHPMPYPVWHGEHSNGDALLICGEQGFGDVLHFARYAQVAKEQFGGEIYAEVRLPVARLMQGVQGVDRVIVLGEKRPEGIGYYINMVSLASAVGTEKGFMGPYLKADPHLVDYWAKLFAKIPEGVRVGLCWAGLNRTDQLVASAIDGRRSLHLSQFAPLAAIRGISWVSIQLGEPATQIKSPPTGMVIVDVSKELDDFYDTAAMIENLDLVITVDTSVVHLAAGLGKPTWMLGRFDGCWRWFGDRADSPWYPTLRQYRQPKDGDWESVLDAVTRDLQRFVANKRKLQAA
jgi:Flp pilus assembly protein TadD